MEDGGVGELEVEESVEDDWCEFQGCSSVGDPF